MIIPATTTWTSDAVELFPLREDDVTESYVGWLNDPLINSYLESRFEEQTLETARAFVVEHVNREDSLLLGIRYLDGGDRHVGNIKVEINARHGLGEIGIMIGEKSAHGKGIGSEAIRILSRIARTELRLRKLIASCYGSNKGSERAFVKAGFAVEGIRPAHFLREGEAESATLMGLIL